MTDQEIVDMIQVNLDPATPQRLTLAKSAYNSALDSLGKEDLAPWNKLSTTESLTASKGTYIIGADLLSDYAGNIKSVSEIYLTSEKDWQIKILPSDLFNHYKRGNTDEGKPYYATIVNDSQGRPTLEFFYTPDAAYTVWLLFRLRLRLSMIPEEFHDLVWSKGVLFASNVGSVFYNKAKEIYMDSYSKLSSVSYQKWDGTFLKPDLMFGERGRLKADSGNLWGLV